MDAPGEFWYISNMDNAQSRGQIENFNLFGEAAELPDVVHCETIEARSILHNWEFKPHRHARLHQVLLVDAGGGTARVETQTLSLRPGAVLNVPTGCVHGFVFHEKTQGWVVTLSSELLDEVLRADEGLRPILARPALADADAGLRRVVSQIFEEYAARDFARAQMLRALSSQLLGQVARALHRLDDSDAALPDAPLRARFERLLEETFRQHWSVSDYARALSVSPTHLSRVLRQATGLPASRAIEDRVLREARRQLFYTNLSIAEIAYLLGYNDPAYFSRVFARATGMAPSAFRARVDRA